MGWRPHSLRIVAMIVPFLLLAACNSDKQEAIPTTTTKTQPPVAKFPTTRPGAPTTAPPVARPLDASTYEADPCASLTDTQKQTFGIERVEPTDISSDGNECNFYRGTGYPEPIWVVFPSRNKTGLSKLYAEHAAGAWDHWEPTKVNGYPAVEFTEYNRGTHCSFGVGISDHLYYFVSADLIPGEELCETPQNIATMILENIRTTE